MVSLVLVVRHHYPPGRVNQVPDAGIRTSLGKQLVEPTRCKHQWLETLVLLLQKLFKAIGGGAFVTQFLQGQCCIPGSGLTCIDTSQPVEILSHRDMNLPGKIQLVFTDAITATP